MGRPEPAPRLLLPPGKMISVPARLAVLVLLLVLGPRPGLAADCRPIADFARYTVGEFPDDWKPKEDRAREIYKVLEQGGLRFIRATARSTGLQIGREFDWDLKAFPALAWKWRPQLFPHGADERESGKNDSALGVYAVFPQGPASVKTVKYVWSATVPAGTTASASRGLTRMIVLRSGERVDGKWVAETANVAQDYAKLFGEPPKQPRGIALLTDADDTKSAAVGDYTDFRVCPAEEATSSQQEDAKPAAKAPAPAPAKPAKPATSGKRVEKAPAARTPAVVEERTPPVDRPPIRYSRPAAVTPAFAEPEKR
jgi:Protein of unknown function (DUF3047)